MTIPKVFRRDPTAAPEVMSPDLSDCLVEAMKALHVEINDVAIDWQVDASYVSRVLDNSKPLPDYRIAQLSEPLQQQMLIEWAKSLRMIVGRKAALILALEGLNALAREDDAPTRSRMARMDLESPKAKKETG